MNTEQKKALLSLARQAIASELGRGKLEMPEDPVFQIKRGLFVTLHLEDRLRGCIGYIVGYKSIAESIVDMARAAAFRDPRFPKVKADELDRIQIEISLLGELLPVLDPEEIEIGRDGLYIEHPQGSGLLLPQVAIEWGWDRPVFLKQVCQKAGLKQDAFKEEAAKLYRFTAEIFNEGDSF